ncbi:MAG: hypothetical protein RML38_01760 [Bacteroidia bacterium]|nr:hypothetical protein [Bacteroidia bacterium]
MAKLFLFGIGGTGARVIKHFTFLLANGVPLSGIDTVVPILVDPDKGNGDLNKTLSIVDLYTRIRNNVDLSQSEFFKVKLSTLYSIAKEMDANSISTMNEDAFTQKIQGIQSKKFKDYISLSTLTRETQALCRLLFSDENLETPLDVGFKGNPNMGSVVLNQFSQSDFFNFFASSFDRNDKIFIISSIFGGTGSSGFPILLKNLRNPSESIPKHDYIKNAIIGAITVLPYFNLENDANSKINSNTFISKAKAALDYYQHTIIPNKELNILYYVGDNENATYKNAEGGQLQENRAHFVEFISALSVFDFVELQGLSTEMGRASQTFAKEFGLVEDNIHVVHFPHFSHKERKKIQNPMIQFYFMYRYFEDKLPNAPKSKSPWVQDSKINLGDSSYEDMKKFLSYYKEWLEEMAGNRIAFKPFKLNEGNKEELFSSIEGIQPPKKGFSLFGSKSDYEVFEDALNTASKNLSKDISNFKRFLSLMSVSTSSIIEKKQLNF